MGGSDNVAEVLEWLQQGVAHHRAGRLDEAATLYQRVLEHEPEQPDAWHVLGVLAAQRGDLAGAIHKIRQAIARRPDDPAFHGNLGKALAESGNLEGAIGSLRRALDLAPGYDVARLRLGRALTRAGRHHEAIDTYRAALRLSPDKVEIITALAGALRDLGRYTEAVDLLNDAVGRQPNVPHLANELAVVLQGLGDVEGAIRIWTRLTASSPDYPFAYMNLADELSRQGAQDEAVATYSAALRVRPDPAIEIRRAITVSPLPASNDEITAVRGAMMARIQDLLAHPPALQDPFAQVKTTPFFLAYHGRDDRALNEALAQLYLKCCPALAYVAAHCRSRPRRSGRRVRVGVISTFFHDHTIGKLQRGLVENIDRSRIELFVFCTPFLVPQPVQDSVRGIFETAPEHAIELPLELQGARERIAAAELDVLYYTDIGMAPFTYFLAFSRLAPVQAVTWGHPDTTGVPTVDHFVSCGAMEPVDGERHYAEHLVRLPGLTLYYHRPPEPSRKADRPRDLPPGRLYLCPQSLFKLHPDFDAALIDILRLDRRGRLVLVDQHRTAYQARLRARLLAAGGADVVDRIHYVPAMSRAEFVSLLAAADVMLDAFHFSGGNTSLEALAVGTPIVTWPGEFMRGRHTHGLYGLMGLEDCIARDPKDYVERAVAIATGAERRAELGQVIREKSGVLYEDRASIQAVEDWFIRAAD